MKECVFVLEVIVEVCWDEIVFPFDVIVWGEDGFVEWGAARWGFLDTMPDFWGVLKDEEVRFSHGSSIGL